MYVCIQVCICIAHQFECFGRRGRICPGTPPRTPRVYSFKRVVLLLLPPLLFENNETLMPYQRSMPSWYMGSTSIQDEGRFERMNLTQTRWKHSTSDTSSSQNSVGHIWPYVQTHTYIHTYIYNWSLCAYFSFKDSYLNSCICSKQASSQPFLSKPDIHDTYIHYIHL